MRAAEYDNTSITLKGLVEFADLTTAVGKKASGMQAARKAGMPEWALQFFDAAAYQSELAGVAETFLAGIELEEVSVA